VTALSVWDASHRAFYAAITSAAVGGHIVEVAPGVTCAVVPSAPERSLPNGVCVEDAAAFAAALPEIRALYARAGVRAWTVWVGPGRDALRAACEEAGLAYDGGPMLMHARLDAVDLAGEPEFEVVEDGPAADVWALNDAAWGMPAGAGFCDAFTGAPSAALRRFVAVREGEPLGCVCSVRSGEDAYVCLVAVPAASRGQGVCGGLMRHALRRARAEGATTTTLEGSPMGRPIYARMGYVEAGPCELREARVTTS